MEDKRIRLTVNCVLIDPVGIEMSHGTKCYEGYEFFINQEDKEEMLKFIEETIINNGLPIDSIRFSKIYPGAPEGVDTKEDIVKKVLEKKDAVLWQLDFSERAYGKNLRDGKIVPAVEIYAYCVEDDNSEYKDYPGLRYDGYSFMVKAEDKNKMTRFLTETIIAAGIPLITVGSRDVELLNERDISTKKDIVLEVLKEKRYLLEQYRELKKKKNNNK